MQLPIGDPRLHEYLNVIVALPEGITVEEFRVRVFPASKNRRGAQRMLSELRLRGLVETVGMRYRLTFAGHAVLRGESPPEPSQVAEVSSIAPPPLTAHEQRLSEMWRAAGVTKPTPPKPPWNPAQDGLEWARGADGRWWSRPADGSRPARTRDVYGHCWEIVGGLHVRPRWLNKWGLPLDEDSQVIEEFPVALEPLGELEQRGTPWTRAPDGKWWRLVDGIWWSIDEYGTPRPTLDEQGRPLLRWGT